MKTEAEENIRRLEEEICNLGETVENCNENINRKEEEKKTKESLLEKALAKSESLTKRIRRNQARLDSNVRTVDTLKPEIRENLKRQREELEEEEIEFGVKKQVKLTGEYVEYAEPEIKKEVKKEVKEEVKEDDLGNMEQPGTRSEAADRPKCLSYWRRKSL